MAAQPPTESSAAEETAAPTTPAPRATPRPAAARPAAQPAAERPAAQHAAARPAPAAAPERRPSQAPLVIGAIVTLLLAGLFLGGMLVVTVVNLLNTPQLPLG